jgi:hypothetical protein
LVQAHDLDAALTTNGIPHEFEEFTGTYTDKLAEHVENKLLHFSLAFCSNARSFPARDISPFSVLPNDGFSNRRRMKQISTDERISRKYC